ncbi:MAG: hypothetical protein ACFHHU_01415 [Porticoccaceae bacterium]
MTKKKKKKNLSDRQTPPARFVEKTIGQMTQEVVEAVEITPEHWGSSHFNR